MERKEMDRLERYFTTIARREGVENIAVGLFVVAKDRLLVRRQDGQYTIPKARIGEGMAMGQAIKILAKEQGVSSIDGITWVGKELEMIGEQQAHVLHFAVSGKVRKDTEFIWVPHEKLPDSMKKTMEKYLKKQGKLISPSVCRQCVRVRAGQAPLQR